MNRRLFDLIEFPFRAMILLVGSIIAVATNATILRVLTMATQ